MYLDHLANRIRSHLPEHLVPDDAELLFRMYAVLALAKGKEVTTEDVHNAWVAWMAGKDPDHPALFPYEDLDRSTQEQDEPFVAAIRAALDAD